MAVETITITAEGANVATLSGRIYEPRVGVWWAEVEVDGEILPSGAAVLSIHNKLDLSGTVSEKRTVTDNGRVMIRIEGGSGSLDDKVKSQSFRKVKLKDVLSALFFETGDEIDPSSTVLSHEIPYWTWGETMGEAVLHSLAAEANAAWRVTRSGAVWIGEETWPEVDADYAFEQGPIKPGMMVVWPELPLLRPGMLFQGKRVSEVITSWGGSEHPIQQQVVFEQTSDKKPTRFQRTIQTDVVDWIERTKGQEIDLSKHYPCKVVGQSADMLTVDLKPDDAVVRGNGLQNVPLRFGVPGFFPRLKTGARCHLGWEAADPKRPYAALFEAEGVLEIVHQPDIDADITIRCRGGGRVLIEAEEGSTINLNGDVVVNNGGREVACKGDLVYMAAPTATAPGAPCAPAQPGAPSLVAVIGTGSARFKGA